MKKILPGFKEKIYLKQILKSVLYFRTYKNLIMKLMSPEVLGYIIFLRYCFMTNNYLDLVIIYLFINLSLKSLKNMGKNGKYSALSQD